MYKLTDGLRALPRLITNREYYMLGYTDRYFYKLVKEGGKATSFDKSSDFKGEIKKSKKTIEEEAYEDEVAKYKNYLDSPLSLNRFCRQDFYD